jgi:hypothetical protein
MPPARRPSWPLWGLCILSSALLGACDGVGSDAPIGGTLSGLPNGQQFVLQNNASDDLTLTRNGDFRFDTRLKAGTRYSVSILTQPAGVTCSASNGSGKVNSRGDGVFDVKVVCDTGLSTGLSLGGTLAGLQAGTSVTLNSNGMSVVLTQNGFFQFKDSLPAGTPYQVVVTQQPLQGKCSVSHASGSIVAGKLSLVNVDCQ